ncbi:MAG: gamma-glutamyl-gamma-aminobutyrate hydrolase family protein [Steroidobacteraceae bacterium]
MFSIFDDCGRASRTSRRHEPVQTHHRNSGGPQDAGQHPFHAVGEKYIHAVEVAADAFPLLIPVLPAPLPVEEILARVDGILFTGSPSNVEPRHYGDEAQSPDIWLDPERDATTLRLIPAAIERVSRCSAFVAASRR